MKKSTYIIIGFLGVLALMAFIVPPIFFRKNVFSDITISDSYTKSELPSFSAIDIYSTYTYGDKPIVLIKGVADGEEAGVLELNQAWADNSAFVVEDDILTINLNIYGDEDYKGKYHGENKPAVIVYVDSTLMSLNCRNNASLVVENLNNADLSVNGDFDMTVNNSRFNSLSFCEKESDYADISLTLNDTSSVDWLALSDYEFRLCTNDSAFVDTIMLAPDDNLGIELGESRFNALINNSENGGTSRISLNSPATITRN